MILSYHKMAPLGSAGQLEKGKPFMNARENIEQLVTTQSAPLLRQAGFKKTAFNFHRRQGEVMQVVNFQLSAANLGETGCFYINVGLNFDPICALEGRAVEPQPKEYACHFRARLEKLLPEAPPAWHFSSEADRLRLADPLQAVTAALLQRLDGLDSAAAFQKSAWFQQAGYGLKAQVLYLAGDGAAAAAVLREERDFFQSRPNWNLEERLKQRGLTALAPLVCAGQAQLRSAPPGRFVQRGQ